MAVAPLELVATCRRERDRNLDHATLLPESNCSDRGKLRRGHGLSYRAGSGLNEDVCPLGQDLEELLDVLVSQTDAPRTHRAPDAGRIRRPVEA